VDVRRDPEGKSKGYGFIEFEQHEKAKIAVEYLDGASVNDRCFRAELSAFPPEQLVEMYLFLSNSRYKKTARQRAEKEKRAEGLRLERGSDHKTHSVAATETTPPTKSPAKEVNEKVIEKEKEKRKESERGKGKGREKEREKEKRRERRKEKRREKGRGREKKRSRKREYSDSDYTYSDYSYDYEYSYPSDEYTYSDYY
jgi:RNA recognition motif-containing protein